jgi:hypothetical protein
MLPLLSDATGVLNTVTVLIAVFVPAQPNALVPVMKYTALNVGDTTGFPPENVYENAPAGFRVKDCPEHIVPLLTVIVGLGFTVTLDTTVFALMQPCTLVPVMV